MSSPDPIDWRHAPWLAPSRAQSDGQRDRHEAALAVLDEYNAVGSPFALFLRTFHVRQLYCHASVGGDGGDGILLEVHFARQLQQIGANLIRVQDPSLDIAFPNETPALLLDHASWRTGVTALIDSAELIISECEFLTPGVVDELNACREAGKIDQTVLVVPSPPLDGITGEELIQDFPRMIHQHDMDMACPARSMVFQDLVDRMEQIGRIEPTARQRLSRERKLRDVIPVSYDGVTEGLFRLAQEYADRKNPNATFFAGYRGVLAARAADGLERATEYQLSLADLCEQAGDAKLGVVLIDEAETNIDDSGSPLGGESADRLRASARRRRTEVLGRLFESLMNAEQAEELWQLAKSQGSSALQRDDRVGFAQCLSWMSVAANLGGRYELAIDHASDAIGLAHQSGDEYREAFSYFYLGTAYRGLDRVHEAAEAFAKAVVLFPKENQGRIHAAAMLNLAIVSEQIGHSEAAAQLFRAARDMAEGLGQADLATAADLGVARMSAAPSHATDEIDRRRGS